MSLDEAELLGTMLTTDIAQVFCVTVFSGIYMVIASAAICTILRHHDRVKSTWALLVFFCTIFILVMANLLAGLMKLLAFIHAAFLDSSAGSSADQLERALENEVFIKFMHLESALSGQAGFLILIGDTIVVWRAWFICSTRRKLVLVPLSTLLYSFVNDIVAIQFNQSTSNISSASTPFGILIISGLPISLITNAIVTVLIGYQLYENVKMKRHPSQQLRSNAAYRILLILIESGVIYCILQGVAIALTVPDNTLGSCLHYAATVWMSLTVFFSAVYPSVIILIAHNHSASRVTRDISCFQPGADMRFETGISMVFTIPPPVLGESQVRIPDSDCQIATSHDSYDLERS